LSLPLDNQRASFYGQFIQAACAMFKNPQGPDPLRPEPAGIPTTYELGAWVHMSDLIFDVTEPKFYGIVARGVGDPDSRIIAIPGTEGAMEWIDDAAAIPVPFRQVPSAGRVAQGFDKIYYTLKVVKLQFNSSDFAKNSLVCWHSVETYLHRFDPTLPSLVECVR
jgi:hypothetical protein